MANNQESAFGPNSDNTDELFREFLDSLKPRLADFLERHNVFLFECGSSLSGLCPVHDDTRPSFSVYGDTHERWKCFACDKGGDIFDLIVEMKLAKNFSQAVAFAAESFGVPLPKSFRIKKAHSGKMAKARKFPMKSSAGSSEMSEEECDDRLFVRHNLRESIRKWPQRISNISRSLGIPAEVIKRAARGQSGLGLYRGKLAYVYPNAVKIRNAPGDKVRFFWLFGRPNAPWRMERVTESTKTVYVTEGESDALALIVAGVEDDRSSVVVASPGTSFKRQWAPLFAGKSVIICFDFDEPGQRAASKVADLLAPYAEGVGIVGPIV